MYWFLSTAKDEELRKREEALKEGETLLKNMPHLKTKEEVIWNETGAGEDLRLLCELLKRNAIPTKTMSLNGDEKEE